eukprot:2446894-Alexandrium_andersonii.AAC.1
MFAAFLHNAPTGEWTRQELPEPPAFEAWWKSWRGGSSRQRCCSLSSALQNPSASMGSTSGA